jgi:hypothetical protein
MNWRLTKKQDIITVYQNRQKKYKDLILEQFFYRVFVHTTFKKSKNGNSDDNDEKDAVASNENCILVPKGMNCIPIYPVDYDYAQGMLILHKPWSMDNTLNSILKYLQKTINTFLFMIDNKEVPSLVTFQYHTAMKYARQEKLKYLSNRALTTQTLMKGI